MTHITTEEVIQLLENSDQSIFLTGNAWTGKTFTIKRFQEQTTKTFAVCAPTWIAAINAGGTTIYKLLSYIPGMTKQQKERHYDRDNMYKKRNFLCSLDCIILDEVSMMRSDTLDEFEEMLQYARESDEPFGWVQMIFVWDLMQLPPVVTQKERGAFSGSSTSMYESCFPIDARSWKWANPKIIKLTKIYRQEWDTSFVDILNEVRLGCISMPQLLKLNERVWKRELNSISIVSTNDICEKINRQELTKLMSKSITIRWKVTGKFDMKMSIVDEVYDLKIGARVMIVANWQRWANGEIWTLTHIDSAWEQCRAVVQKDDWTTVTINQYTWTIEDKYYDKHDRKMKSIILWSFTQLPLKLAWAITIHKSQWLTFENVHLDLTQWIFATWQLYVALSRCKSLQWLTLEVPIKQMRVQADPKLWQFDNLLRKI